MENTEKPASADSPITQARDAWWIRFIRCVKRKIEERAAKKQKETPADKAARIAANATVWIAIFTVVSVGVSVFTYLILKGQLKEMHDGGVDTHTLAEQALAQGTLLRQQVTGTFAAAIPKTTPWPRSITNDLEFLNYTGIGLSYVNVGKIKATKFVAEATLTRQSLPSYKPLGMAQRKKVNQDQIRPNDQNGPNSIGDAASIRFDTKVLTQQDLTSLSDSRETLEISGYFQYENGFGDIVREPICFLYAVRMQHVFPSGPATGGSGTGEWYPCEDAKIVIRQAQEWKQGHPKPN